MSAGDRATTGRRARSPGLCAPSKRSGSTAIARASGVSSSAVGLVASHYASKTSTIGLGAATRAAAGRHASKTSTIGLASSLRRLHCPVGFDRINITDGSVVSTTAYPAEVQGQQAYDVIFDGSYLWSSHDVAGRVLRVNTLDGSTVGSYLVGNSPRRLVYDGHGIWVTNAVDSTVTRLSAVDGATLGTFGVGSHPEGIAFDGANIWVAGYGGNILSKL